MTDSAKDQLSSINGPPRLSFGAKFFLSLSLLMSLGALAIGLGFYYQGTLLQTKNEQSQRLTETVASLEVKLTQLNAQKLELATQVADMTAQTQQLSGAAKSSVAAIAALEEQTERRVASVRGELSVEIQKLTDNAADAAVLVELLEVRYLLRSANLRMHVQGDTAGANRLLEEAAARLQGNDDLMVLPLKAQLEANLAAVKQLAPIEPASILAQLQEIEQALPATQFALTLTKDRPASEEADSAWQQLLQSINQLVQVRRLNLVDAANFDARVHLNDAEQKLAQLKFDIAISQARAAVLTRDTQGFRRQLVSMRDWHDTFTDTNSAASAVNKAALDGLLQLDLAPRPYDLTRALKLADQILVGRL